MRGFIEAWAEHEVRGWAFDETEPDAHVAIHARLDGNLVGSAVANGPRHDLKDAGFGKGDHEFRVEFNPLLAPCEVSRLQVVACNRENLLTLSVLPGSIQSRVDQSSDASIPFVDSTHRPVFVLGPARSGTSAVTLALLKSGCYEGHGEGHLIPLMQDLLSVIEAYYHNRSEVVRRNTLLRSIHQETFERSIRRSFIQLVRSAYPTGQWVDKTPTAAMVRGAPLMREIWPNAKFIFLKRRVLENVLSRRRKFPEEAFENHYLDWIDVLSAWQEVRSRLVGAYLEIDQMEMACNTVTVANNVVDFLHLSKSHGFRFVEALSLDYPERTSSSLQLQATMEDLELSIESEEKMRIACDKVMKDFGYTYDKRYYAC